MASSTTSKSNPASAQSHFLQVSKNTVILLEILPFLTQSQAEGGERPAWFSRQHLKELLELLQQHDVKSICMEDPKETNNNKQPSSKFIVTGTTLRAACIFRKRSGDDTCLIAKKFQGFKSKFQELNKVVDKLVVHVCPKSKSSMLNVTQLLHSESEVNTVNQQISKYFQPVADIIDH